MVTVAIRSVILFVTAVVAMRIMGKRQISQLQPYELVVAITIADLAATPMEDVGVPLLHGIVPIMALVLVHSLLAILSLKCPRLRAFICGTPSVLIKKGVVQEAELRRVCFDMNELFEEIRAAGILNPADAGTAILETSGKMSVFPHADRRPVQPKDIRTHVSYEGIPLTLVLDGEIQYQNLTVGGLGESWLTKTLESFGFQSAKDILLASLDTQGMMFVQGKGGEPRIAFRQAMEPEKVSW